MFGGVLSQNLIEDKKEKGPYRNLIYLPEFGIYWCRQSLFRLIVQMLTHTVHLMESAEISSWGDAEISRGDAKS